VKNSTWFWIAAGAVAVVSFGGFQYLMGSLTASQIKTFAANAGFVGQDLITSVAVALAESSGNPQAHGDLNIGSGSGSFGLWQINADSHPEYGPDFSSLFDPQTNANAAYTIYLNAGMRFTPWSTFKNSAYLSYISQAQNA
jgi:Lysozyme like domain